VEDGVTGAIVETMEEAIAALPRVIALDRKKVRQCFEQRFSATRMAKDYISIYRSLVKIPSPREQEIELAPNGKDLNILRPLVA
jgi:hypothetical protein